MKETETRTTAFTLTKLPKGFYYMFTKREIRSILEKITQFHGFINSVHFANISVDEQKAAGKALRSIHLKYGITAVEIRYSKKYCWIFIYGLRDLSLPFSKITVETQFQIQEDMISWLRNMFSLPQTAPDTTHRLYIKFSRKEDGITVYSNSITEERR